MSRFERKPRSARESELLEATRRYLPAGVRNPTTSPSYAMVVKQASGSRLTDFSDNEYLDYLMGSGPLLLGHAHPAVVAAVRDHLERGSSYLMVSEPALLLAEQVHRAVPCADKIVFNVTGSESVAVAMRIARAHTGRERILKFEGAFHGMSDYALMSNQWTAEPRDYPHPVANSAGIPRSVESEVLIAPFNDIETTTAIIEKHAAELAAVVVEPLQRTIAPREGFLQELRRITAHLGIALVFDEVVTGFRLAYGGAQEYYGVVPDLAAVCKGIASGHPISILCGSEEFMAVADPMRQAQGLAHVMQTGTFSGNPLSCSAALATIGELQREGVYEALHAKGRKLMDGLRGLLDEAGIAAQVTGEPPAFQVWFTDREVVDFRSMKTADFAMNARFTELLMDRGIIKAHEKFFVSTAHSDEDIDFTLEVLGEVVDELKGAAQCSTKPSRSPLPAT